ncbi:MAG: hypothetical protein CVU05_14485 [Bacteroidetes bacterium HGW-Bacteroidetes-21]|jgi:hypothetical protein|nr:MAG: hypothetical protein CVU05_14485 [Bacteroidetes bacterium HGW-Bacteroidetes-21]
MKLLILLVSVFYINVALSNPSYIPENSGDNEINFYYSAIDRALVLECNDNNNHRITIEVYNITGNSVFRADAELYSERSNQISLELKPGMYIICLIENNKKVSKKILIK